MNYAALLLIVAIAFQSVAAVLALRLNWIYGRRWAWWLISAGILLMTVRRAVSLYRTITFDDIDPLAEEAIGTTAACISLLVSMLILAGMALIEPIFRDLARAEYLLREERNSLQAVVKETEVEMRMARRVQQSLLPTGPLQHEAIEIAGTGSFVNETGGDVFDYFRLPNGSILVYLADVSGHGLGAAMIAMQTRTYMRALAETGLNDPGVMLQRLNHFLVEDENSQFVTMFLTILDPAAQEFVYASAGHPAWLLDASGQTQQLDSLSIPLGIDGGANVDESRVAPIPLGSVLLLATDGVYEAHRPNGGEFGIHRALDIVRANRHQPASTISERLQAEVREFSNGLLHDDITTVVVKHLQSSHPRRGWHLQQLARLPRK
ncbi:MAG: PP2C family protein-serine/threonine phosphatase [Planctomycetota bacterium]|nr:PP2C family protein-serine/threonine phosphatase [Planctomycetota bacterium]